MRDGESRFQYFPSCSLQTVTTWITSQPESLRLAFLEEEEVEKVDSYYHSEAVPHTTPLQNYHCAAIPLLLLTCIGMQMDEHVGWFTFQ